MPESAAQQLPFAITLRAGTSLANRTGAWRSLSVASNRVCSHAGASVSPGFVT